MGKTHRGLKPELKRQMKKYLGDKRPKVGKTVGWEVKTWAENTEGEKSGIKKLWGKGRRLEKPSTQSTVFREKKHGHSM